MSANSSSRSSAYAASIRKLATAAELFERGKLERANLRRRPFRASQDGSARLLTRSICPDVLHATALARIGKAHYE